MKTQIIIIIILALALIVAITKILLNNGNCKSDITNAIINNIMTRTSIRVFNGEPISNTQIDTLLQAGMAAPSAINKQPWCFVVIKNRQLLQQLGDTLPNTRLTSKTACAIAVCGDMTKAAEGVSHDFWIQDCAAATENILLAAHAIGLGAVWAGIYPNPERTDKLREMLKIPSTQIPLSIIAIGHPAENPVPKDKWKPENIRIIE